MAAKFTELRKELKSYKHIKKNNNKIIIIIIIIIIMQLHKTKFKRMKVIAKLFSMT
jgi:hypothetical protein